ncbi:hypothetical protein [Kribbella sp. CA-294648]|uniref:hypothetical protein n=1 Tax=Kribbella sp. CA-294648 TaxID=3239948 RepID=UPI003D8D64BE
MAAGTSGRLPLTASATPTWEQPKASRANSTTPSTVSSTPSKSYSSTASWAKMAAGSLPALSRPGLTDSVASVVGAFESPWRLLAAACYVPLMIGQWRWPGKLRRRIQELAETGEPPSTTTPDD